MQRGIRQFLIGIEDEQLPLLRQPPRPPRMRRPAIPHFLDRLVDVAHRSHGQRVGLRSRLLRGGLIIRFQGATLGYKCKRRQVTLIFVVILRGILLSPAAALPQPASLATPGRTLNPIVTSQYGATHRPYFRVFLRVRFRKGLTRPLMLLGQHVNQLVDE